MFEYADVADMLGEKNYTDFDDDKPEKLIYFEKYVYPKNMTGKQDDDLEEKLDDWADETGKIYQFLANEAEIVDRVFAGLAIRLKG